MAVIESIEALKALDTPQKIYNHVVGHLREQGKQSTKFNGDCMYRNGGGLFCAVGCLIPDSEYSPDLEDTSFEGIMDDELTNEMKELLEPYSRMLGLLQYIHDKNPPSKWEERFKFNQDSMGIEYTPPTKEV